MCTHICTFQFESFATYLWGESVAMNAKSSMPPAGEAAVLVGDEAGLVSAGEFSPDCPPPLSPSAPDKGKGGSSLGCSYRQ